MRVRAFTNRGSTTKVIGKFPSQKNGRSVWWESQIERDFIYLLEFDSEVLSYQEQPLRIQYVRDGRLHKYTPDFLVTRADKRQIIEVKPARKAQSEESKIIFRIVAAICRREGYEFLVATDTMIRVQPRLSNIKLLWRYSSTLILPQYQIYCHELLWEERQIELFRLIQFLNSKNIGEQIVYALLYQGHLETDLMRPISPHSILRLPSIAERH